MEGHSQHSDVSTLDQHTSVLSSDSIYIFDNTKCIFFMKSVWTWQVLSELHHKLSLQYIHQEFFFPSFQGKGCARFNVQLLMQCTRTLRCALWMKNHWKKLAYSAVAQGGLHHTDRRSNWQEVWGSWVFYGVKTNNFSWVFQHWTVPDSFEPSQGLTQTPLTLSRLLPSSPAALLIVNRLGNVIYSTAAIADMLSAMP